VEEHRPSSLWSELLIDGWKSINYIAYGVQFKDG